jgi:hypothetical protein
VDLDSDGVLNDVDQCEYSFGAKEKNGCPCYQTARRQAIDDFYDGLLGKALAGLNEASACPDKGAQPDDLAAWREKVTAAKNPPTDPYN